MRSREISSMRVCWGVAVAQAFLIAAVAATNTHAGPLSKPEAGEARSHLALGNKLYGVRSFDKAVEEYKAGALVEPAPVFDYNLGQCYRMLGRYDEAIWHYERFLSRGNPQGEILDAVKGFLTQMRSELEKKAMTQKPVEPGPVQGLEAAPGQTLDAVHSPSRNAAPALAIDRQLAARRTEEWYDDRWGWALAGSGVIGLAVGGGLLISGSNLSHDANAAGSQREYDRLHDKANTRSVIGAVVGIGGAGLLLTGVIKLAVNPKETSSVARWNVAASDDRLIVFGAF